VAEPASGYELKRLRAKAQSKALTKLAKLHQDRYADLYRQYRAVGRKASAAQSRARMRMRLEYPIVYRELYEKELREMGLHTPSTGHNLT
jgi:hypothetical protein